MSIEKLRSRYDNLQRYSKNPIRVADQYNWWESKAVFNPAILYDGNKVHMLYRAIGEREKYISRIGYAYSKDGLNFEQTKRNCY